MRVRELVAGRVVCDTVVNHSGVAVTTATNSSINGTLDVSGTATFAGSLVANGGIIADGGVFSVANTSGNTVIAGSLAANGGITCDTNKFTVADTSGNVATAGTLSVAGATALNGGVTCDTDKFVIADTTGATTIKAPLTVGVDGTGHDVQFFGDTSGKYMKWDQANDLFSVTGGAAFTGNTTFGVDDTGVDVVMYGATTGKYTMWDESADKLIVEANIDINEGVTLDATAASGVKHLIKDSAGKTLLATGTTVPSDAGSLYAKGCLFIDTDVATGTTGLYVNVGTADSCVFKAVSNAA